MESMSDLIASETLTCKCLRCLCHPNSNLWKTVVSSCVAPYDSPLSLSSLGRSLASPSPDLSYGARATIQTAGSGGQHGGLWLRGQFSGLLSFVKVYLGFLLNSKFDEVIIGRPLTCGLPINYMGHPGSQLRVHASKEAIN